MYVMLGLKCYEMEVEYCICCSLVATVKKQKTTLQSKTPTALRHFHTSIYVAHSSSYNMRPSHTHTLSTAHTHTYTQHPWKGQGLYHFRLLAISSLPLWLPWCSVSIAGGDGIVSAGCSALYPCQPQAREDEHSGLLTRFLLSSMIAIDLPLSMSCWFSNI